VEDYLLDHRYRKLHPSGWLPQHAYHRPLATYVEELVRAGFRIERVVEAHRRDADAGGVPGLLYARTVQGALPNGFTNVGMRLRPRLSANVGPRAD